MSARDRDIVNREKEETESANCPATCTVACQTAAVEDPFNIWLAAATRTEKRSRHHGASPGGRAGGEEGREDDGPASTGFRDMLTAKASLTNSADAADADALPVLGGDRLAAAQAACSCLNPGLWEEGG